MHCLFNKNFRSQFSTANKLLTILILNFIFDTNADKLHQENPVEQIVQTKTGHRYEGHARYKRQFEAPASSQIDLNITVPYIFSARLYPYGRNHGDEIAHSDPQSLRLQTPLYLLERNYETIYIHHDGIISLEPNFEQLSTNLPLSSPLIAVYWLKSKMGRIYYRESTDPNILNLVQNEVNIQYRYGNDFQTKSVVIITWEELINQKEHDIKSKNSNTFQVALILGDNACFAHFVYNRLSSGNAVAGFNGVADDELALIPTHFALPGSGSSQSLQLIEKSNIGIPGEWLFRIDEEKIYLCGAGFHGLECVDSCSPNQWYLDCSRQCHCADGNACNSETGECPNGQCNPGWEGSPICDQDINECNDLTVGCPAEQPDCVNTPGSYLCLCFEYDNVTNVCKGSNPSVGAEKIPVPVMPLVPLLFPSPTQRPSQPQRKQSTAFGVDRFTSSIQPDSSNLQTVTPNILHSKLWEEPEKAFGISSATTIGGANKRFPEIPKGLIDFAGDTDGFTRQINPISPSFLATTLAPLTIRPILASRAPSNNLNHRQQQQSTSFQSLSTIKPSSHRLPANECHRCHHMAQCVEGHCICLSGWFGDGQNCEDVNECEKEKACGPHSECQNTIGSYQCVCDVGFIATVNGCVDVDECTDGLVECPGANSSVCVNTIGGYECQCHSGFTGHPNSAHGCIDIDECELSTYYCGEKAKCINSIGSFTCECFEGYEIAKDSRRCTDMNECAHNACDPNAICTNLEGTFTCDCIEGYFGNGIECHESVLFSTTDRNVTIVSDALKSVPLNEPVTVFGKEYSSIYISPFGLISFDQPLQGMIRSAASELRTAALLPFHLVYNLATSGEVTIQQYSGGINSNEQLTKASLTIQNKFNAPDFRAVAVYIITFDKMREINLEKANTFQVLIIKGVDNSTFVVFLYERLESIPRGISGVASPSKFTPIPVDLETFDSMRSNVGQKGKWIFKIDNPLKTIACPTGLQGAPYCDQACPTGTWGFDCENQCHCEKNVPCDPKNGFCSNGKCTAGFSGINCNRDIDECNDGTNRCSINAKCINTMGGYECKCNLHYRGDGFYCEAIDRCLMRFGVQCAPNAHCDTTSIDLPECVCKEGYHGDGRHECAPDEESTTPAKATPSTTSATTSNTLFAVQQQGETFIKDNDRSSVHNNLVSANIFGSRQRKPIFVQNNTTDSTPTMKPKIVNFNETDIANVEQNVVTQMESESSTDSSGMILIFGPIVFCAIWLLLIIIFLLICLCRKQRSRSEKYVPQMMGWSPRDYTSTRSNYFSQFTYT